MRYKEPDNGFFINVDNLCEHRGKSPSIVPFWIDLPKLIEKNYRFWSPDKSECPILNPMPDKIANFGLPREEQYFKRREMPMRLQSLIKEITRKRRSDKKRGVIDDEVGLIEEIWLTLGNNQDQYVNEIQYIKEELYFCYYGYWVYIDEKPTWIPPNHYQMLTHWEGDFEVMDRVTGVKKKSRYAEYRDVDRRKYAAALYTFLTTETFEKIDPKTWRAIPEEDGTYKMIDLGFRTMFGFIRPKPRRAGDTVGFLSWQEFMTACVQSLNSNIITNDPDLTEDHWTSKVIPGWKNRPFFMKAMFSNSTLPAGEISYDEPARKGRGKLTKLNVDYKPLGSKIVKSEKVTRKQYDGQKLNGFQLFDEEGKPTDGVDISDSADIVKPSMSMGAGASISKFALMMKPSTVEEFGGSAAPFFKKQCDQSNPYIRNPINGQTISGLMYIFFSAYDGLEDRIGPFGESVIDTPTPEQAAYMRSNIGSREYLDTMMDRLEKSKNVEDQETYRSLSRKYPRCWEDMWKIMEGGLGFNVENINYAKNRLDDLILEGLDPRVRGDFRCVVETGQELSADEFIRMRLHHKGFDDYYIKWVPNPEGRFYMSQNIDPAQTNRRRWNSRAMFWEPMLELHIGASDPVQYMSERDAKRREDKAKSSTAAAAWRLKFDKSIDGDKPRSKWKTGRFVLTYFSKVHNDKVTLEEMLWACIYLGCKMFPEVNYPSVVQHFEERGFGGFLHYAYDIVTGTYSNTPGFRTGTGFGSKDALFSCISQYTDEEIIYENHIDIVDQVGSIQSKDEMTKFDGFAAAAGCLLAEVLDYKKPVIYNNTSKGGMSRDELLNHWIP